MSFIIKFEFPEDNDGYLSCVPHSKCYETEPCLYCPIKAMIDGKEIHTVEDTKTR